LLLFVQVAWAIRLTEDDFRRIAAALAPEVERVAERRFVEVPALTLEDELTGSNSKALALYRPARTRIEVSIPVLRDLLRGVEYAELDPMPQVRCVLAHELTHALQHQ
jgi:hypothetical protein